MKNLILAVFLLAQVSANAGTIINRGRGATVTQGGSGITSINSDTTSAQVITSGTSGTDVGVATSGGTTTISIPTASSSNRGALSSTDWSTFNSKESALTFSAPLSRSVNTVSIPNAAADGSTKGAASFTAADFDSSSGNISIDYTNGQAASGSTKGFLTSADWTTFNNKLSSTGFVESYTGHIETAANKTYVIDHYAAYAKQIVNIRIKCTSGSITAALKIGGTNITNCSAISVTSTSATTTCDTGSTNDLAANSELTLVTTSNSTCTDLVWAIKTTRD